jgi:thioredoxin-related protein
MKTRILGFIVLICVFTFMIPSAGAGGNMPWVNDWKSAKKTGTESDRLIMIYFWADWCNYCKILEKGVFVSPQILELAEQIVPLKVDGEHNGSGLAMKYQVGGYPTFLFIDARGEVLRRINGFVETRELAGEMRQAIDMYKALPVIQAKLKENPGDGEANIRMAFIMASRSKTREAESALGKAEAAKYSGEALAKAYNAIGDDYQLKGKYDKAIAYFTKGDDAAMNVYDRAYAKASMMTCYTSKNDLKNAKRIANEILTLRGVPWNYLSEAKKVLNQ